MQQSERWNSEGLATVPLSHCGQVAFLPGYLARYYVLGSPDAPPLILLPGLAGGIDLSLPLASRLSQQFCVYLVQPRGEDSPYDFGPRTTLEELGADIIEFQRQLGLERPLICGHGFGAIVALEVVRQCPGRFAGAVVQGIAPNFTASFCELALSANDQSLVSALLGSRWVLPQLKQLTSDLCGRSDAGVIARRLQLMARFDLDQFVDGLRQVPLLIQTAAHDVFVSPEAWKPWRRVLPRMTQQTIENAGHLAFLTHAESLASQVERFANRRLGVPMQLPAM